MNVLNAEQRDIAERFAGKDGSKGADCFKGTQWKAQPPGAPLLVGALAAIDCEVEDMIVRNSHAIVIGRVRELKLLAQSSALAHWRGEYVAIEQDENVALLAEASLPLPGLRRKV